MSAKPAVVVAMSGGVDSSVAAALLVKQGYPVIGMMLRLWSEEGMERENRCCTPDAMAQARRVAGMLGIPFYAVDAQEPFYQNVVINFIDGYKKGLTPNPCLYCNRQIRWGLLLDKARAVGAELMATGHYARIKISSNTKAELFRACDYHKDQSYVLSMLNQEQLSHSLFPLGTYMKAEVRKMAREIGLPVAERPDSQDLCFLSGQDYRQFLRRISPGAIQPGLIVNQQGIILGHHDGLAFYTIGQRKGLQIASSQPQYVLQKDFDRNILIVGTKDELGSSYMEVGKINWIDGEQPRQTIRAQVKIRYKADFAEGLVTPISASGAKVQFDKPLRDITAGQVAVFYDGDKVLGGGIIQR
jgi:tRNA-specific 2-thiouridylase